MNFDEIKFEGSQQCDDSNPRWKGCQSMKRLIYALQYYMDVEEGGKDGINAFTDFIKSEYRTCLNDIIHLSVHDNDLEDIHHSLFTEYGMKQCDLTKCKLSGRHCAESRENERIAKDGISTFYADCFDSVHHYLFHLFDLGLRTLKTETEIEQQVDNVSDDEGDRFRYVDRVFSRKQQRMKSIRKELKDLFTRCNDGDNKFIIQGRSESLIESKDDQTYSDRFLNGLSLFDDVSIRLEQYLKDNAFDSDAVKQDIDRYPNAQNSNICTLVDEDAAIERIGLFVNKRRCMLPECAVSLCFRTFKSSVSSVVFFCDQCNLEGLAPELRGGIGPISLPKATASINEQMDSQRL